MVSPNGLPVFSDSARTRSSAWSSMASASLRSASCLSEGVVSRHVSNALSAASKARSTSACSETGASANVWPVAGLTGILSSLAQGDAAEDLPDDPVCGEGSDVRGSHARGDHLDHVGPDHL